ncbi:hypothetical protein MtrunA17_Chr5g0396441 [Medicago truncatula]|uniref:Uncharacterized protein n=1 Tax=Medicago truncatula TaxID=3880 RepID=A0A396HNP6_MEDTR|nr:hypothetical protein MtrunA17_Chr5g0396441 [Medicago truncatula]
MDTNPFSLIRCEEDSVFSSFHRRRLQHREPLLHESTIYQKRVTRYSIVG